MRVLHISSDYPFTPLYQQLLMHYAPTVGQHVMYVPLSIGATCPRKYDYEAPNVKLVYSEDYPRWTRYLYHHKRRCITEAIGRQVPLDTNTVVHAHYLFSGGGVAHQLKQTKGINYVVAVRNTDLNAFFKYAVHLRSFGVRILQEASAVIFLSPAYREALLEKYVPVSLRAAIRDKSRVVPNGISDYWLQNTFSRSPRGGLGKTVRLCYVGSFTRNKNLQTILQVVRQLQRRGYKPHLSLVGDGPDGRRIRGLAQDLGDQVTFRSWTESQAQLRDVYRDSDVFVMPSREETFGLVYGEAMSQGLPVVYSRGQGIDGYFPDGTVGYHCNPSDPLEITDRVEAIIGQYDRISARCVNAVEAFSWHRIATEYEDLYRLFCQDKG